jgi:outer membrane surface antigen
MAVLALALPAGGCSFSYQLGSLLGNDDPKPEYTGKLAPQPLPEPPVAASGLPEGDLAYARAAALDVVAREGKTLSAPWENPRTGARGTFTPLAAAYTTDGTTCRDFLASYVRNGSESWLQGEACRGLQGRWEVRQMRPWRRT